MHQFFVTLIVSEELMLDRDRYIDRYTELIWSALVILYGDHYGARNCTRTTQRNSSIYVGTHTITCVYMSFIPNTSTLLLK